MERLVAKYAGKLVSAGLADQGAPLLGGLDADLIWSRKDDLIGLFEEVFAALNINSLLYCRPKEPYASMIDYLATGSNGTIYPRDTETRTFLHDLPVVYDLTSDSVVRALERRKSVIVQGGAIVTFGTVSPEQAFVAFSSVCFACFVKFHADFLQMKRKGKVDPEACRILERAQPLLQRLSMKPPELLTGPFVSEEEVHAAMIQAGRLTVEHQLVDSFFGNLSYRLGDTLYISQTSSSLEELAGCIDPCRLDGSTATGLTASSELVAHLRIVKETEIRAILHGHPKFPVILSLDCEEEDCEHRAECHTRCPKERSIGDIPIVTGEVGSGKFGLHKTLPPTIKDNRGVIVFGHGLFTASQNDFKDAFANLESIEQDCRDEFLTRAFK